MTFDKVDTFFWETAKIIGIGALALFLFSPLILKDSLESVLLEHKRELAEKSFTIHKSQVGNQIKQCEALRESSNSYHAGNWRIEISDKGFRVECRQEGYRIPR